MAKPEVPNQITLNDLINCGQGDTIVSILTDAKAFFDYDQREVGNTLNVDAVNIEEEAVLAQHPPAHDPSPEVLSSLTGGSLASANHTTTFGKATKKVHSYNEV